MIKNGNLKKMNLKFGENQDDIQEILDAINTIEKGSSIETENFVIYSKMKKEDSSQMNLFE